MGIPLLNSTNGPQSAFRECTTSIDPRLVRIISENHIHLTASFSSLNGLIQINDPVVFWSFRNNRLRPISFTCFSSQKLEMSSLQKVCYGNAFNPAPHKMEDWPKCLNNSWMVGTVDKANGVVFVLGIVPTETAPTGKFSVFDVFWCICVLQYSLV